MLDLSLNIKGCSTLAEALKRATQSDRLDGNNSYFCEKYVVVVVVCSVVIVSRIHTIMLSIIVVIDLFTDAKGKSQLRRCSPSIVHLVS